MKSTGVQLDDVVLQSWVLPYYTTGPGPNQIPANLPDNPTDGATHTALIRTVVPLLTDAPAIPTVSTFGFVVMSLVVLTAGILIIGHRRRQGIA